MIADAATAVLRHHFYRLFDMDDKPCENQMSSKLVKKNSKSPVWLQE